MGLSRVRDFLYFYKKLRIMANDKINWVNIRVTITEEMHEDLKIIKDECGVNPSNFTRPLIRQKIESFSNFLPVGSNRKKED